MIGRQFERIAGPFFRDEGSDLLLVLGFLATFMTQSFGFTKCLVMPII